jgi:lipopolysaccharide transport system ATP-binding protein
MKPHIEVRELSKAYTIGHDIVSYRALRDELSVVLKHPIRSSRGHRRETEVLWALRDVSFDVQQGDVLGVIGRNGSGKSTLLKILSRIVAPTEGRAVLRGRVSSLLEVGTGFNPELTGRENVFLNGALLGMSRREIVSKFDEIVDFSEIEKFLDTPVKFYSSGMYVRLAFAVAANLDPDVLIVDEVLSVGDAAFQRKSLGKMSRVASDGRTVLFVSHNAQSVLELCTRGIHLSSGRLVGMGSAADALDSYRRETEDRRERSADGLGREHTGVYITRVETRDAAGETPLLYESGEPLVLELEAEVAPELRGSVLHAQFTVDTEVGGRVFTAHSSWAEVPVIADATITVRCTIDEAYLTPGRFFVSAWVSTADESLDHIERAASFEIAPTREFLDPKRIPAYGPVDFPHRFEQIETVRTVGSSGGSAEQ